MSSRHRRKTARQNGAKAAGTKTPEGIAISSQNARRHGLTSKVLVLANESQDLYLALEQDYMNRFQPADGVEMDLVDDLVSARWLLRRIWGMQTAAIDLKMAIQQADVTERFIEVDPATCAVVAFSALANEEKSLQLLLRYETTYNRMYNRALKTLRDLQKDRQTQAESTESEKLRNDPKPAPESARECAKYPEKDSSLPQIKQSGVYPAHHPDSNPDPECLGVADMPRKLLNEAQFRTDPLSS